MLLVEVSANGGASFQAVRTFQTSTAPNWNAETITAAELTAAGVGVGSNLVVRFTANDSGAASIHEAGIDGFEVGSITCDPTDVGSVFCSPAIQNSTGGFASLAATGSDVLADNDLTLEAVSYTHLTLPTILLV